MVDGSQTPALFEGVMGDHPSKLTAGLMSAFRAHFRGGERAGKLHGGGRKNKVGRCFTKPVKGELGGQGKSHGQSRILVFLYGIREKSCNKGGFSWVRIPVAFPVTPIQPSLHLGQPRLDGMAGGGPALQRMVVSISAGRRIFFCLPGRWKAALWLAKAGLKDAQLLCVNWSSQAKGVFNRGESCCECSGDYPPQGLKIAELKHSDNWQMCLEVTRG